MTDDTRIADWDRYIEFQKSPAIFEYAAGDTIWKELEHIPSTVAVVWRSQDRLIRVYESCGEVVYDAFDDKGKPVAVPIHVIKAVVNRWKQLFRSAQ